MRFLKSLLFTLCLIVSAVFSMANHAPVELSLFPLPYAMSLPLAFVVLMGIAAGVLVGVMISGAKARRFKRQWKVEKKRAEALSSELDVTKISHREAEKKDAPTLAMIANG